MGRKMRGPKEKAKTRHLNLVFTMSAIFTVLCIFANMPTFKVFGLEKPYSVIFSVILSIITSVFGFCLVWHRPERAERKICISLFALMMGYVWISVFGLPDKIFIFIYLLLVFASAAFSAVCMRKSDDMPLFETIFPLILSLLGLIIFLEKISRYNCLNDFFKNKMVYITIILSAFAAVASYTIIKKLKPEIKAKTKTSLNKKEKARKKELWGDILIVFVVAIMAFTMLLPCINVTFDFFEPVSKSVVVEDMYWNRSGKSTAYRLLVSIDGKEHWLNVSSGFYYDTDIGQSIDVDIYGGALGEPYAVVRTEK